MYHWCCRYGDYGALYKELLEYKDNNEEWHVWYPVDNHFPTDDDLKGFKASTACCNTHSRIGMQALSKSHDIHHLCRQSV